MKKRLLRNLLILGLLLVALTAAVSAVKFSGLFSPESEYVSAQVNWETSPSEYIILDVTVPSKNTTCPACSSATAVKPITLQSIQYPVNDNYHQIVVKISIPKFTCETCGTTTGPLENRTVIFTNPDNYFCHSGSSFNLLKTTLETNTEYGDTTYVLSTIPKTKRLTSITKKDATCTEIGYSKNCWYCDFCKQYFDNNAGNGTPLTDVEIPALGHDYDPTTGKCKREGCTVQATASLNGKFKETLAIAVEEYNTENGGELRAFITPEDSTSFTLMKSGKLIVTNGVALPDIILEGNPTVTIENAGTISSIKMSESSTLTINNSGTISSIEMNQPGTLTIDNSGEITSINTSIVKNGDEPRTITVTNHSAGVIGEIKAPNATLTVQNDGKIESLIGYFYQDMVKLLRGSGLYANIISKKPVFNNTDLSVETVNFVTCLNAEDDYFYFPDESNVERKWVRSNFYKTEEQHTLNNVYISGHPIASIGVTGTADNAALTPATDAEGRLTMTVQVGQTVALTGSFTVPTQGLKSTEDHISYSWRCKHAGSTTSGKGQPYTLTDIQYGTYELTLTLTDSQYSYSKSLTFYLHAIQPAGQRTTLYLKGFDKEKITKSYDSTTKAPKYLNIVFCNENKETVAVESQYYTVTIAYDDPNCGADKTITAKVELTPEGAEVYSLGTHNSAELTSSAAITRAGTSYMLHQKNAVEARVGGTVFQCLELRAIWYVVEGAAVVDTRSLFDPVTPGTDITVEGEPLSVAFYRLHPANITGRGSNGGITDFIHDPSMNEELTANSTFTAAGEYYVYAVVQPTQNFEGVEKTSCLVINVQDTKTSTDHHSEGGYTAWDGTITASVPVAANRTNSVYLSSSLPTIYTELLLSQKKNLTLCLNGKTLSTTNIFTSYNHIRVTDSAALTIDDCIGTGTVKGTAVNGGQGGIAYVKNGTITIKRGKFTGGTASTGGGAIVVDAGGTLIIEGGEISGNTVTNGKGGAIYIKNGGTVTITGGKITDNHVYSGNGGAIYVEAGGTLNLYGGTITGNTASGLGGGIYVEAGGRVNIQGAPVVTGNTAGGKANNVYVCADSTSPLLTISGELTDGAKLGVSTDASYPVLLANREQDYSAYFTPDDPDAFVLFSGSALTLCAKPSATLEGDTLTVKTGSNYKSDAFVLFVAEYGADGRLLAVHSEKITAESGTYTFKVQPGATIKCFLLHADTYAPLFAAFSPKA